MDKAAALTGPVFKPARVRTISLRLYPIREIGENVASRSIARNIESLWNSGVMATLAS
ncbi:MAG: hypothetical protein ACI8PT_001379 [Gammaproteobacteria bacterium]|jgi:hypothetical protein